MTLNITTAEMKRVFKKLSFVNTVNFILDSEIGMLVAVDNDLSIAVKHPSLLVKDDVPKKMVIPAKQFTSAVAGLSGEMRMIYPGIGAPLVLESGKTRFDIPLSQAPKLILPAPPENQLTLAMESVTPVLSFAAAVVEKNSQFDFSGSILLTSTANNLQAAGTDHKRLAIAIQSADVAEGLRLLIPLRAAQAIRELDGKTLNVGETDNALFFQSGTTLIVARKLIDKFPDFEALIPRNFTVEARIDSNTMRESLKRVAPMAKGPDAKTTPVVVSIDGDTLRLKAGDSVNGKAVDEIGIDMIKPDPMLDEPTTFEFKINHHYLTEFFNLVNGSVFFGGTEPMAPVWFKAGNFKLLVATLN